MIIDSKGMKLLEQSSGRTTAELMEDAGKAIAAAVESLTGPHDSILFIAGKGNNGGDAYAAARVIHRKAQVYAAFGKPVTEEAAAQYDALPDKRHRKRNLTRAIENCDVIVDCLYGFGYHGDLNDKARAYAAMINSSGKRVFSVDINSGAESDTGRYDRDAVISEYTFALDCYKPFHMLRKEHRLFKYCMLLDLQIPHTLKSDFLEMDADLFFRNFPKKDESSYKGTFGKTLLIGGSYGMAGALMLNIIGAETAAAPYIEAGLPDAIYPIAAGRFITPVYHPYSDYNYEEVLLPAIEQAKAVGFGSGMANLNIRNSLLDLVLQNARGPVILDAEAIRLLQHNTYIFRFVREPVILTPHIGEFACMINKPVHVINEARLSYARDFAKENKVYLVLKGANTIVASPHGEVYISQAGSQALARAGSGDVLTGIMAGILTRVSDVFTGVCMAVWLHGYLAEYACSTLGSEAELFHLERYPEIMEALMHNITAGKDQ
ncbi:MAG: NAD(P)H-hydrate dehydratase [Solobacterium sp.]|nr:NAD(P)H-hydrate dehydratase [Solobacterium sp.]